MYENTFNLDFFTNFLFGFIFIFISILFSIKISKNVAIKKIFFFEEFQPLIIFFLIFSLYTLIFNLTTLINYSLISELFFLIFFLKIIFIFKAFERKKIIHIDQILTVFLVKVLEIKIGKNNNPKNKIDT